MENSKNLKQLYRLQTQDEYNSMSHPLADQLRNIGIPLDIPESLPISIRNDVHNNMNGMIDFLFEDNVNIRIIVNGSTPDCTLFCGPDVARILGYGDRVDNMYRILTDYEKVDIDITKLTVRDMDSQFTDTTNLTPHNVRGQDSQHGGLRHMMFITLPGLFRVINSSRKPKAMEFQNWIYHVVLPSIWSYGYYASPNTRTMLEHDPNIVHDLNIKISELETKNSEYINKINEMEPYANMGNFMLSNMSPITIEELAKVLNSSGIIIGRDRLFKLLAEDGYLMKTGEGNRPTQKALNMGIMTYNITPLPNGTPYTYVYVLPKGILYFINKYANYTNE